MSAHDQIRTMLDQLMGTARNGQEEKTSLSFDDPRVCKSFLLGCCPHDILASTRMDLGECAKYHNVALRADYEKAAANKDYFYDLDAVEQLADFIAEADRKTEQAKKRLAETQEEVTSEVAGKADKIHELAEKIGENLAKAEKLGADGKVEESMKLMEEVEDLKKQKSEAEGEYRASIPSATYQQQKLRVCEVCCAYLGIHDNDRRLADHFGGKLHLGFIKLRETLAEYQGNIEERRRKYREHLRNPVRRISEDRDERRRENRDRRDRDRGRDRSRDRRPSDDRDRRHHSSSKRSKRSRSRDRGTKRRDRSGSPYSRNRYDKDKSRSRSRSTSKDRKKHKHRRHSKSRSGSRSHHRRHRSNSLSGEESGEI